MPFLKALMPDAKSPISSEILPRPPNKSSTARMTSTPCIHLTEPLALFLPPARRVPPRCFTPEMRLRTRQKQGLRPIGRVRNRAVYGRSKRPRCVTATQAPLVLAGWLRPRRQPEVEIARLERILVLAQRRIVGRRR